MTNRVQTYDAVRAAQRLVDALATLDPEFAVVDARRVNAGVGLGEPRLEALVLRFATTPRKTVVIFYDSHQGRRVGGEGDGASIVRFRQLKPRQVVTSIVSAHWASRTVFPEPDGATTTVRGESPP